MSNRFGTPPLRALLQVVHREGLGRADVGDPRRVGRAADQGAVVLLRGEGGVLRQQGQQGEEPDLRVQLPALRAGADVGRDDRCDRGAGRRGASRGAASSGSRSPDGRVVEVDGRRRDVHDPGRGDLVAAAARGRRDGAARRRRRRSSTPRAACATATSSPSRSSSTARISSPTTGSTSTSRACASAASRTSARGRPGWSRTPTRRASGSSTSASPATISGRWPTTTSSSSPRRSSSSSASRRQSKVERGFAIRVPKAYPIYDADYAERVATIRAWLDGIENLQQVGRNGLHRYNNSDHSMLTAMRAVDNLLAGARPRHLGGQRRERVPRDRRGRRAPVSHRSGDARDAGARSRALSSRAVLLPVATTVASAGAARLARAGRRSGGRRSTSTRS